MRVISALLLLSCVAGVLGQTPAQSFNVMGNTGGTSWTIDGQANPSINVTVGNLYAFNITFGNAAHPFNFTGDGTTANGVVLSAIDPAFIVSTTGTCTSAVSTAATGPSNTGLFGYVASAAPTTPCTVWLNVTQAALNKTLFYRCSQHPNMVGSITVWAAATSTPTPTTAATATPTPTTSGATSAPTNASNATPTPTATPSGTPTPTAAPSGPTTGGSLSGTSFRIVGADAVKGWIFQDTTGAQYYNPTLSVTPGANLTFSLEYTGTHPFGLSPTNAATIAATTDYFPDALNSATKTSNANTSICDGTATPNIKAYTTNIVTNTQPYGCTLYIQVPTDGAGKTIYYRCAFHPAMIGTINVQNTPTQKPNTASTVSALVAFVVAVIAAFFN